MHKARQYIFNRSNTSESVVCEKNIVTLLSYWNSAIRREFPPVT